MRNKSYLLLVFFAIYMHLKIILKCSCFFLISGNVFVLAAIWMEKNLHSLQNYLIFSLAVADLMVRLRLNLYVVTISQFFGLLQVACLVMPLGAVYEVCIQLSFFPHNNHHAFFSNSILLHHIILMWMCIVHACYSS